MILPTKHISERRSLIGQGALILELLSKREHTVSSLWEALCQLTEKDGKAAFDWFVLALDLLYALRTVELDRGVLKLIRKNYDDPSSLQQPSLF